MAFPIAAALIAGGSIMGGLLSKSSADKANESSVEAARIAAAPWEGVQPYLVGGGAVPGYLSARPEVNPEWQTWNQGIGLGTEGSWLQPAPPMYMNQDSGQPTYDPYAGVQQPQATQMQQPTQGIGMGGGTHYMGTGMTGEPIFYDDQQYRDYWSQPRYTEGGA